ncbi:MAG: lipopolysaccharide biosynthesis protein [Candidatus Cryptobacteroides sp.]
MSSITTDTISGVKWTAIEKFSTQIVNFLLGLLLARLLTPSDFGTIGMLGIFMAISNTFIDSGFSNALIRKPKISDEDYSTAFYFNIIVGFVCYALMFACSPLIAAFFEMPILTSIVKVYSVTLFINSLTSVQYAKLNRELNFKLQAKISFVSALSTGLIGVGLAYMGFGVWALVWQAIASSVLRAGMLWALAHWHPQSRFSRQSFRYLFSYGSKLLASGLLHTLYSNLSTVAIGKFYTAGDLGYYSKGNQFAVLPTNSITGILQKVTFPLLAKIQNEDERLIRVYRKYIRITSCGIFFLMCLLASLARPLVEFLLTDKWIEAAVYVQIFCFALMFDHICQLNLNLLQVKGRSDLFLKLEIIKKSIAFAILCAAIPLGVKAICISSVVYTQIAVYINTYYTGKLFGLGYLSQIGDFGKYLVFSLVACSPAFLMTYSAMSPFVIMLLGSILAVIVYYGILCICKDKDFYELLHLIKQKLYYDWLGKAHKK